MTRFRKEAKMVDSGEMAVVDFCQVVSPARTPDWAQVWAAARIYKEDGGRRFSAEQFRQEAMAELGCEEDEEVKNLFGQFMTSP